MADESDGIEEAFEGQLRVLVTAAGRVGETFARAREDAMRKAQAASEQEARELSSRFEAERQTAHTEFGNVYRNDWWDKASPEQIGNTYQTARAWSNDDPEAVRAESRMRDELRSRYGVDVNNTNADPAAVREAVERAQQNYGQSDAERQRGTAEEAEAARLLGEADAADRAAAAAEGTGPGTATGVGPGAEPEYETDRARNDRESREASAEFVREHNEGNPANPWVQLDDGRAANLDVEREKESRGLPNRADDAERAHSQAASARGDAAPLYDSAERRQQTAADLESKGVSAEAVGAKMRADVSQAKPATEATKGAVSKAPKARNSRGRAPQAQRTEPSR
uniref:hypothetical protein n=1 Tax=Cryobacterium sp. TaxID=1926290 RepID=UPI0015977751|nr:hypothetical protein [Cryobacterium sp.]QJS06047.1 hypothetical protein [Cryobacterium sp.]